MHRRLKEAGRLISESVGDQFVFTNIIPQGMSSLQLYEGYRKLLERLYGYNNYRRRVMQIILARGPRVRARMSASRHGLGVFARVLWTCILKASPSRVWLTLSLLIETALRRPRALSQAVALAVMHKHFYEYMRDTCKRLERLVEELRQAPEQLSRGAA
ncbi:MAG: DUF4070 domain-containing protein [Thermoanaerobaculia bacterium]